MADPIHRLLVAAVLAGVAAPTLAFEMHRFRMQPEAEAAPEPADLEPPAVRPVFGEEGSWWFTLGGLYAYDFDDNTDVNIHAAASTFIVEDVEVSFELALWGHLQDEDDAFSLNPNLVFRWHFLHDEAKDWTVYADTGIGLLFATDNVPDEGSGFNFTPRAGVGFTTRLGDGDARWMAGVRWHHISNARINGEDRNPSRDAPAFYTGIMFPF